MIVEWTAAIDDGAAEFNGVYWAIADGSLRERFKSV
jgi:hypothetical protein